MIWLAVENFKGRGTHAHILTEAWLATVQDCALHLGVGLQRHAPGVLAKDDVFEPGASG